MLPHVVGEAMVGFRELIVDQFAVDHQSGSQHPYGHGAPLSTHPGEPRPRSVGLSLASATAPARDKRDRRRRLELPSWFRPVDYQTISDVMLNISYTAEEDGVLRQDPELQHANFAGGLLHFRKTTRLRECSAAGRAVSLSRGR